jgi:hypothetical protein
MAIIQEQQIEDWAQRCVDGELEAVQEEIAAADVGFWPTLRLVVARQSEMLGADAQQYSSPTFACSRQPKRPRKTRMVFGKKKVQCERCGHWKNPNSYLPHVCSDVG